MTADVDAVHAAYYTIMHLVFDLFGYSPLSLRLPSAIAVGVAAGLTVVLVRLFGDGRHAVLAGVIFCLLPRVVWMGTEGRSYAMSAALGVAMTLVLVVAIRSPLRRWWIVYVAVSVLACAIFIYLALFVIAHGVGVAWWAVSARRRSLRTVLRWAASAAVTGACVLPLALAIEAQSAQISWIDDIGPDTVRQVFRTQWFLYDYPFATVGWVLIAAGIVVMGMAKRYGWLTSRPTPASEPVGGGPSLLAITVPILVLPTAALIVATALYSPLYSPRYVTMSTPFVGVAIAASVAAIRPRLIGAITLLLIVALAVPAAIAERRPRAKQLSTWSEVADLIAEERAETPDSTTAIIYGWVRRHPTATSRVIAYSYPPAFEGTIDVTLRTPAAQSGQLWETRAPLTESLDRLDGADTAYLITSITRDLRPDTTATMESIGWRLTEEWNLVDVNVVKYSRTSSTE